MLESKKRQLSLFNVFFEYIYNTWKNLQIDFMVDQNVFNLITTMEQQTLQQKVLSKLYNMVFWNDILNTREENLWDVL